MTDSATAGLQAYVVGGAVRDALLGLPAGDRDWVVVGSTPQAMTQRGFMPVGGDFPVFLHPVTKEEYALARTERKTALGYQGFTFYTGEDVTLTDDLKRRDLTVNAIAQAADGTLIDPLGGAADVAARVFRHVGRAFSEDPVRILRLARFAARFADFTVAPETMALCSEMVQAGEADALVAERVWKEVARGLMATAPSRMFDILAQCGALERIMPQLNATPRALAAVDTAARSNMTLPQRYALLCVESPERDALSQRMRVPQLCADYARLLPIMLDGLARRDDLDARLALIERADALRKPERFEALLAAAALWDERVEVSAWSVDAACVRGVDAGAVARGQAANPAGIKEAVREARLAALKGAV